MKIIIGYIVALALSLFSGKLIAGAISGILISPLEKPLERVTWVSKYLVPFLQGIAMGVVAVATAQWVLPFFGLKLDWAMIALIVIGFVVIAFNLMKNIKEKHQNKEKMDTWVVKKHLVLIVRQKYKMNNFCI